MAVSESTPPPASGDGVNAAQTPAAVAATTTTAEDVAHDVPADEPALSKRHTNVVEHARLAAGKEQNMTLMEGLRLYPKAIAFSVIISTCIVMEGYDISLVTNFCTLW